MPALRPPRPCSGRMRDTHDEGAEVRDTEGKLSDEVSSGSHGSDGHPDVPSIFLFLVRHPWNIRSNPLVLVVTQP